MDLSNEEFFKFLSKLQSERLDDQRCTISTTMAENSVDSAEGETKIPPLKKEPIDEVLLAGKPYPLVVLPVTGDFWQEGTNHVCSFDKRGKHIIKKIDPADLVIEDDLGYSVYKNFFKNQWQYFSIINAVYDLISTFQVKEHFNFTSYSSLGSLLLSLKYEENCAGCDEKDGDIVRIILRSSDRTIQGAISSKELPSCPGPRDIVKQFVPDLLEDFSELQFQPVIYPKASSLITRFDEHGHAEKFKVGVIYQRAQQTSEGQFFSNKSHSKAMHDFLQILGEEVELFGFKGYNGGLDTKNHQTGRKSVYTKYKGREIMFHVSTLLPYTTGDSQQLQRKRHIGNDIIAIIFQDENTPFCPTSIRSSFLHIFIVVQVEEAYSKNTRYKITVTAKEDVPEFGPSLPNPAVFSKNDPHLRDFLLTKLLNAELAAFKAKQFATLMERTRKLLFEDLVSSLAKKSQEMLLPCVDGITGSQSKGKIFHSLRNAFRTDSFERDVTPRSKSLENLVQDDEMDKQTRKKRSQSHIKRYSLSGDRTRKAFRPKSKSMFQAPPLSAIETAEAKERMLCTQEENDDDVSPTFSRRDQSPSGSFHILPSDQSKPTSIVKTKSVDSGETKERGTPEMSRSNETTTQHKRLNGLIPSPRIRKKATVSPAIERKNVLNSTDGDLAENKADIVEDEESLVATLRGDIYRLSCEKARLQRENDSLREDVKGYKEAMIKQAEDLCESQYQLNLLLSNTKLPASAV